MSHAMVTDAELFDVVIVGAGLSGIDAAHHLQQLCKSKSYVILESRDGIGGTWHLFRYPGIRSDSDMLTMGYRHRPWTNPKTISPGAEIRKYIEDTAQEEGIDRHIRLKHRVISAKWSSATGQWTLQVERADASGALEIVLLRCSFLFSCSGYYRYSQGYLPQFPGQENFKGRIVHPQHWHEEIDYDQKKVVVIGSGATAVTLVPAMAQHARQVTMLQRSPTYVVSMPGVDRAANWLRGVLPPQWAYRLARWRNLFAMTLMYQLSIRFREYAKRQLIAGVRAQLGAEYDVEKHFTPTYFPWQQRLCLVPDGDFFLAIKSGRASVVTDHIECFDEAGIQLRSGARIDADLIVVATGLELETFGGIALSVDGQPVDAAKTLAYKGVMFSGVPNFASVFGYINASWTLKADLICGFVARLLNYMDRNHYRQVTPQLHAGEHAVAPMVENFSAGYMQRGIANWPKQGAKLPWQVHQNYFKDLWHLRWRPLADGRLVFSKRPSSAGESKLELRAAAE